MRRCIWAHPLDGAKKRIVFPKVTLGTSLNGHHGLTDHAVRASAGGGTVHLEIAIDGAVVGRFSRNNVKGWDAWRIDTTSHAGKQAAVSFTVSTANAGVRHYCFDGIIE